MKVANLKKMVKGWIIGNFEPSVLKTELFEVGIKKYKKGDTEALHKHKIAIEFTVIIGGRVRMLGKEYEDGDIIKIPPGHTTDFEAIEDTLTVVIKTPSVKNDKYLISN